MLWKMVNHLFISIYKNSTFFTGRNAAWDFSHLFLWILIKLILPFFKHCLVTVFSLMCVSKSKNLCSCDGKLPSSDSNITTLNVKDSCMRFEVYTGLMLRIHIFCVGTMSSRVVNSWHSEEYVAIIEGWGVILDILKKRVPSS